MANLTDMEELVLLIDKVKIKKYMKEALNCYMASAYRGCILLSCIALFDDLVEKLNELAYVNSDAKEIYSEVEKRINDQNIYENYLIDQLRSKNILTELESSSIKTIKEKRNKSAHPSGHNPSAEEARFIFHEVITNFLSKSKLVTTQRVDSILERLNNKYFFPTRNVNETTLIVKKEVQELHPKVYPYLIIKLIEIIDNNDEEDIITNHAKGFLISLSSLENNEELKKILINKLITEKIEDENFSPYIIGCITNNPKLIYELDEVILKRLKKIIEDNIKNSYKNISRGKIYHPAGNIYNIIKELENEKVLELFEKEILLFIENYPYDIKVFFSLLNDNKIYGKYIEILLSNASSSTFDVANSFVEGIQNIEEELVKILTEKDALKIILGIIRSGDNNAWEAKSIMDNKFENICDIKSMAKSFYKEENKEEINELIEKLNLSTYNFEKIRDNYLLIQ